MLKNRSLHFKLILVFLIIALVLAGVSIYQVRSVQHFNRLFLSLIDDDFERVAALSDIERLSTKIRSQTFEYQHKVFEGEKIDVAAEKASLDTLGVAMRTSEAKYRALVQATDDEVDPKNSQAITSLINSVIMRSLAVVDITGTSPDQKVPEAAEEILTTTQDELDTVIVTAQVAEKVAVNKSDTEVDNTVLALQNSIIITAIVTTALALMLGIIVAGWIARSLSRLKDGAKRIASGDFSHPITVTSSDEIGQLGTTFNHMADRLQESYQHQAVARQRDEAMLLGMSEGLIALDESGKITLINEVACRMLEVPSIAAGVGRSLPDTYELYPADEISDKPLSLSKRPSHIALHTGQATDGTFMFHRTDGHKHSLHVNATPIKLDNKTIGVITVLRDITKEKEVDRMKTEFISIASHQLRTPLSAIKWYSEMLAAGDAGKLKAEQLEFTNNIVSSTERMIDLVNALLNISRIESGRIMIEPLPTDLKELVSGIVSDLKGKTEEKKQTLIISVHDKLGKINLDPRLIGQVYLNLMSNAIKYTQEGGEISVFISRKDDQIISQVTDNGFGIPKDQQARVFQKFFRAANAVKVETDGTGLGLYLIKTIIESSGGKIWFESEEGKGTTFWFSIPASGMKTKEGEVTLDI